MPVTIYGIKTCDTIKKARVWLDAHAVTHVFHDYRVAGIERDRLKCWCDELGWETVLNRAGTTFRALPDADKQGLTASKAIALMLAEPTMIKRPILDVGHRRIVGFRPEIYADQFSK